MSIPDKYTSRFSFENFAKHARVCRDGGRRALAEPASQRLIDSSVDVQVKFPTRASPTSARCKNKVTIAMIHLSRHARIISPVRHDKTHPCSPVRSRASEAHTDGIAFNVKRLAGGKKEETAPIGARKS